MEKYDLGIVGGGPAGYTAALRASAQGKSVVLFEKDEIGGVCLNRGCIPTKSILKSSELYAKIKHCEDFGLTCENLKYDWVKIIERKNSIVERLRKGITLALKNAKVEVVNSFANIRNSTQIEAGGVVYYCEKIICATGSSPRNLKGLEFDHNFILSSDDILELDNLPESILIVGSGAIGVEMARIMSNFGVEVTVVELAKNLLPLADIGVSKRLERIFKSAGIKYYTSTFVEKIDGGRVYLSNGEELTPNKILVATGRILNVDEKISGVEYIGDVAGEIQLAHFAIKQAIELTDDIKFDKNLTPSVVYGSPEIAWVGKREQDLEPGSYKKSEILLSVLGKSHCDGETDGLMKLLTQGDKIVGVHVVSPEASSLVQQVLIAMQNGVGAEKLKEVCFPHPTYSEGIFELLFR